MAIYEAGATTRGVTDDISPPTEDPSADPHSQHGFDLSYVGAPPWDIGRPQPAFEHLAESGALVGRVLDVGCGTGEHALLASSLGLDAVGIDFAPRAIELAKGKASERRQPVRFVVGDVLHLPTMGGQFETVLDCGLFHIFHDEDRDRFASSLEVVVPTGGKYYMLCFSDRQPRGLGSAASHTG